MMLRIVVCLMGLLAVFPLQAESAAAAATAIEKAWALYNEGRLEAAALEFQKARRTQETETRMNAALGLAYVRIRQGKPMEVEALLRRLAEKGYRPAETLSRLVEVRLSLGRFDAAASAADDLPEPLRWEKRQAIADARLRAAFAAGGDPPEAAASFIAAHRDDLARCRAPELFFQAAGTVQQPPLAVETYQSLLKCPLSPALRRGVLESLGWHRYNAGDMESAERLFVRLQKEKPDHRGAALGLGYIRLNTDRAETALAPITAAGLADDPEILELKRRSGRPASGRSNFGRPCQCGPGHGPGIGRRPKPGPSLPRGRFFLRPSAAHPCCPNGQSAGSLLLERRHGAFKPGRLLSPPRRGRRHFQTGYVQRSD